jgi:hypothetical protein
VAVVNAAQRRFMVPDQLMAWAERAPTLPGVRIVVVALALVFAVTFANFMYGGSGWPIIAALAVNGAVLGLLAKRANAIVEELSAATGATGLDLLANVIKEIERETFEGAALLALARRLTGAGGSAAASRGIARLARIAEWADSRHNVFVRLSELPFLFTLQAAYACESWRRDHGSRFRDWVDAVGEMEALLSVAGYSYEHPADPFAELIDDNAPFLDATEMAHPLLPAPTAVSNSFALAGPRPKTSAFAEATADKQDPSPRVFIVSGSNMSGKSTLLRTIGVNVILAESGAPVRASAFVCTPLGVGASIHVEDSLTDGRSRFFAEITRLKQVVDLSHAREGALLFLFDEILSGTNSHDRRAGAEALVSGLVATGAIGLITTHDLALGDIVDRLGTRAENVHFVDHFEDGVLRFDYQLRPGVVRTSNAIALMKAVGLEI